MSRQKIAVFTTDDYIPPAGGAEIALGQIAERLDDFEFHIFCPMLRRVAAVEYRDHIHIHRFGFGWPTVDKLLYVFFAPFFSAIMHRRHQYHGAWLIMASYGGLAGIFFHWLTGVPYILTLQEGDDLEEVEHKMGILRPIFRRLFMCAASVQAISSYLKKWAYHMGYSGVVSVIPNGVNYVQFSKEQNLDEIQRVRTSWGVTSGTMVLITVSRFVKKNAVEDIIQSLVYLPKDAVVILCGFGPLEESLKNLVRELDLQKRVIFAGLVQHDILPLYLQSADVFIRPSVSEGLGNAFLEAMAAKTLVVGTPVGGIPDFLIDNQNGFYCEVHDPKSIAKVVKKIMQLPQEKKNAILNSAQQLVRNKYQWEAVADRMKILFKDYLV